MALLQACVYFLYALVELKLCHFFSWWYLWVLNMLFFSVSFLLLHSTLIQLQVYNPKAYHYVVNVCWYIYSCPKSTNFCGTVYVNSIYILLIMITFLQRIDWKCWHLTWGLEHAKHISPLCAFAHLHNRLTLYVSFCQMVCWWSWEIEARNCSK